MGEASVVDLGVDVGQEPGHGNGLGLGEFKTVRHRLYVPGSLLLATETTPQRRRYALFLWRILARSPVGDAWRGGRGLYRAVLLLVVVRSQRVRNLSGSRTHPAVIVHGRVQGRLLVIQVGKIYVVIVVLVLLVVLHLGRWRILILDFLGFFVFFGCVALIFAIISFIRMILEILGMIVNEIKWLIQMNELMIDLCIILLISLIFSHGVKMITFVLHLNKSRSTLALLWQMAVNLSRCLRFIIKNTNKSEDAIALPLESFWFLCLWKNLFLSKQWKLFNGKRII